MAWLLAFDGGNSSLKVALMDSGVIIGRWKEEDPEPGDMLGRIASDAIAAASRSKAPLSDADRRRLVRVARESVMFHSAIISSVRRGLADELRGALEERGVSRVIEMSSQLRLPYTLLVRAPRAVGPDRLAAAAGVVAAGDCEAIIVDAGTAITVDVLSKSGFLGGAIFPGAELALRALHEGTSALPLVSRASMAVEPPGRNTREAILAGVRWGLVGAVKELVARSRARVARGARIWVTGGGGEALAAHLGGDARWDPDLVFRGLHHIFALNSNQG